MKDFINDKVSLFHGDSIQLIKQIPDNSIHLGIHSPPFANLYIYSDDLADLGNCANSDEFFMQYDYLIPELYRITMPGRLCCVHCKDLVKYKNRDGVAGIYDFSGDIIKHFEKFNWQLHSKITIWKSPVVEMQRTKSHGLLWKQLRKDSTYSRQGLPDYMLIFRKWSKTDIDIEPVTHTKETFPVDMWQRYASPVWFDINQMNVLNVKLAKDSKDEKHLCPLQLDVIERCIELWSNPNDIIFTPFMGIGSEVYQALKMNRRAVGIELKESYFNQSVVNCQNVINEEKQTTFFSNMEV